MAEDSPITQEAVPRSQMMLLAVLCELALLAIAAPLAYFLGASYGLEAIGQPMDLIYGALLSLPLLLIVGVLAESSMRVFRQTRTDLGRLTAMLSECTILDLLIISLLAGVCEEALFRGVLQHVVSDYTNHTVAIVSVSILFGMVHFVSFSYFMFATAIGVYLGVIYIVFDGLGAPMALHAAYDFLALLYAVKLRPLHERVAI